MKQIPIVIIFITLFILSMSAFPATAMDAGPVTTSQGGAAVTGVITPHGAAEQHTVTATPAQVVRPPVPPVPAPLQGNISGIPVVMIAGCVLIALALAGFGYWYIFKK